MAGGLFGQPFVFNEKCIVFSLLCMGLFMYQPNIKNNYILGGALFLIFVMSYVAMAWYDYYFNCDIVPLLRGTHSVTKMFKPPPHAPEKQIGNNTDDNNKKYLLIYALHLFLIAPFLGYIALYQNNVNDMTYPLLGALTLFTTGYHGALMISKIH
uniref:Uncharacterized protein n=1 Tax=viral metagenome TaxID=1070528 RepID=A0A6C0JB74_9ZZZZ